MKSVVETVRTHNQLKDKLNKTAKARHKPSYVFIELEIILSKERLECILPFFKVY